MGVEVAEQKQQLEEKDARVPDARRPAEPGQDLLGHDRLEEKKQKRRQDDRDLKIDSPD
jgi:hypothetical protein